MTVRVVVLLAIIGCAHDAYVRDDYDDYDDYYGDYTTPTPAKPHHAHPGLVADNTLRDNLMNAAHLGITGEETAAIVAIEAHRTITKDTVRECLVVTKAVTQNQKAIADELRAVAARANTPAEAAAGFKHDVDLFELGVIVKEMEETCDALAAAAPSNGVGWYGALKQELLGH